MSNNHAFCVESNTRLELMTTVLEEVLLSERLTTSSLREERRNENIRIEIFPASPAFLFRFILCFHVVNSLSVFHPSDVGKGSSPQFCDVEVRSESSSTTVDGFDFEFPVLIWNLAHITL